MRGYGAGGGAAGPRGFKFPGAQQIGRPAGRPGVPPPAGTESYLKGIVLLEGEAAVQVEL